VSRLRKWVVPVAACGAVAVAAGCGSGSGASGGSGKSLTFVSFGGAFQDNQTKAWSTPLTADQSIKVVNDAPPEPAKLTAMVKAKHVSWDVVEVPAGNAVQWCGSLLEKVNYAGVDRSQFAKGTTTDCGVPAVSYGLLLVYDTKKFGANPPTKLADFFDTKRFPGKRVTSREVETGLLEVGALASGVPKDQLYPLDVKRALSEWDKVKSDTTFAETYGQIQQILVGEQAAMGLVVQARALTSIKEGAPYKPVWDQTLVSSDSLVVPKGAPNADAAMKYIAFATKPEQSAKFAELSGTAPANIQAKPSYDALGVETDPFADGHGEVVNVDPTWWGENGDEARQSFTTWLGG
jgi:putative spermidine/putrescine transport system substrate-binding protein